MASISAQDPLCQEQSHEAPSTSPAALNAELVRQFWDEAKHQVVTGEYLRRKWMPRQGHRFYTLIKVLRGFCSYSIKQGEAPCFPSYETIAQACHVCRRTICTWMAHDEAGRFTHTKHGEALNRFVRVHPRRRYDPAGQRQVKTSNHYLVRMDDPVTPEDEALVWEKATTLAIRHLEQQHKAQEREARKQQVDEASARTASFVERDCTLNDGQAVHAQRGAETAQDRLFSPLPFNTDFHRSPTGEEQAAKVTGTNQAYYNQANRTKNGENADSAAQQSKSNTAAAQREEDRFRRAAPLDDEQERQHEAALKEAYDVAGGVVRSLLEELGDTNALSGTRKVLSSLVATNAPTAQMTDLAYLARDRVRAFMLRGGRILDTQVGFYITTLCNLAKEARRQGWNLEQIAASDRRRHERIISQGEQRTPGHIPSQTLFRPARPAQQRPTPKEAEALIIEWGQQEETYAEAQAQVRRIQEQRQAREGIHQAIQQQALLFSRLAQAEQALKMHPKGSLAWERAEREKQKLERQIAALRQPGGGVASAAPPEGSHDPSMQDRSEQEYRDAIHAWARARRWTVQHSTYGGGQRDWQIGLMAAGRAELRTLAAELGV